MKESIQHDKDDQLEENDAGRQNSFDYYGGGNENNGNRNDHGGNDFEDWANLIDEIDQGGADDDDDSVDLLEESLQKIEDELQRQIDEEIEGAFQKQMDDYFEDCFRQMTMNHDEDEDYGYEDECSSLGDEPWLGPVSGRFDDLRLSSLGPSMPPAWNNILENEKEETDDVESFRAKHSTKKKKSWAPSAVVSSQDINATINDVVERYRSSSDD